MTAVNVVDADGTVNVTAGSDVEATVVVVYTKLGKKAVCCEHLKMLLLLVVTIIHTCMGLERNA